MQWCSLAHAQMCSRADVRRPISHTPLELTQQHSQPRTLWLVAALRRTVGRCWNDSTEEEELVDHKYMCSARDGTNKSSVTMQCSVTSFTRLRVVLNQNESLSFDECLKTHINTLREFFFLLWLSLNCYFICHYVYFDYIPCPVEKLLCLTPHTTLHPQPPTHNPLLTHETSKHGHTETSSPFWHCPPTSRSSNYSS